MCVWMCVSIYVLADVRTPFSPSITTTGVLTGRVHGMTECKGCARTCVCVCVNVCVCMCVRGSEEKERGSRG